MTDWYGTAEHGHMQAIADELARVVCVVDGRRQVGNWLRAQQAEREAQSLARNPTVETVQVETMTTDTWTTT